MSISLGFGDRDYERGQQGFLGSLGASLAGVLSPERDEGIVGGVRAFLNPGPVLAEEGHQRAVREWQTVWQRNAENMNIVRSALSSAAEGEPDALTAADQAMGAFVSDLYQSGFDPSGMMKVYEEQSRRAQQRALQRQDLSQPDATLGLGRFSSGPEESAGLVRSEKLNRMTEAQRAQTEQGTRQGAEAFPLLQEGRQADIDLTRARTGTEGVQQGLYGAQTEREGLVTDILRRTGQMPGTAGAGRRLPLIKTTDAQGNPITIDRNTGETFPGYEDPFNAAIREGLKGDRPATPAAGAPGTTAPPPAEGQAPPAAEPQRRAPSAKELMIEDIRRMSDADLGMVHIDEKSLVAAERKVLDQLRAAAQREMAGQSPERRRAILAQYQRRFLEALSPNANPQ